MKYTVSVIRTGKMIGVKGAIGQVYELTICPSPENHDRIANLIISTVKDALE